MDKWVSEFRGILSPREEFTLPGLFATTVRLEVLANLVVQDFHLPVGVRVIARAETHIDAKVAAKRPPDTKGKLGPTV